MKTAAGNGVFLKLDDKEQILTQGSLLGFVPGVIRGMFDPPTHQDAYTERSFI